jgi:hypothetical protein
MEAQSVKMKEKTLWHGIKIEEPGVNIEMSV